MDSAAYLTLNHMEIKVLCQHLILNHSNSRAFFSPTLLLFQRLDWCTRYFKCPKPTFGSWGNHHLHPPGGRRVAGQKYLKQVPLGKNFLKETLVGSKWATERNQKPVTEKSMTQQSRALLLISSKEAKLGPENSLFKPDAVFAIFISMMNGFDFILNM